jgi:serine/threonine protein kinase
MALEGLQLGQYRLIHLLGSGGMGEVYLAEDARINQQVAIKVSRTEATPYPNNSTIRDAVRLFQREAKTIARLDHPHILSLFSYGEEHVNGMTLIYIVMPYRREGSFVNWLEQRGDNELLTVQNIAYFISQAADALQYAHDNQVVHQDVKPSNFLIRTNKEHPQLPDLLLADFGIARLSTSTSSISHSIRGTPTYMAPEQWSGEPVYATDQYALAVLAYELLAGRPPFVGRQEQVMYQHFSVQPQPPGTFNPQLSKDVDSVILKALAKQPEDRFLSISAFANAFKQATLDLDASTIIKTPYTPKSRDLHVTLAISKVEAQTGTNRILTLPGGRQVSVPVPAGAFNGQVLRLRGMGEPLYDGGQAGTLILTLSVQETGEIASLAQSSNLDRTVPASNRNTSDRTVLSSDKGNGLPVPHSSSFAPNVAEAHHPQPIMRQQGVSTGTAILLVGLAFLIIMGGLGFFYLANLNRSSPNATNSITTTAQNGNTPNIAATSTVQANNANATTTAIASSTATFAVTATSSNYVQLKSSYSGTASGYADGSVTFTLKSEDQQGNISMQTTFQQLGGSQKTASYSCQGSLTRDRHINLQCSNVADPSYLLTVQGYVFPDGHMEGTETATNTNDPNYNHVYSWKAY